MIAWWITPTLLTLLGVHFTYATARSVFHHRAMMTFVVGVMCTVFCALFWIISFLIKALA